MRKGMKATEETKRKMSEAHKGMKKPWTTLRFKGKHNHAQSEETRRKISEGIKKYIESNPIARENRSYKKERHWNWKGDKTPEIVRQRNSEEYKVWRIAVYRRDGYACVLCGDDSSGNLEADHIKPFAFFPDLRFSIENGRTLCKQCHRNTETWGSGACRMYPQVISNKGNI